MKSLLRCIFILSFMIASTAMADTGPFTQAAFDRLQHEGKPILVAIHADWCPTCRAQAPIIASLLKQKDYQGITLLRVDFDNQKEVVRYFHALRQSTLIVFKGGREVGRSLGDTSPEGIKNLISKAL